MPVNTLGESRHNTSVALNYGYDGHGLGHRGQPRAARGKATRSKAAPPASNVNPEEQDFYQAGLNLYIGNFAIGIGGEIYNDLVGIAIMGDSVHHRFLGRRRRRLLQPTMPGSSARNIPTARTISSSATSSTIRS